MEKRNERGHFSKEFRKKIVARIEAGRLSLQQTAERYGIQGHSTVLKWCRRYGRKQYPIIRTINMRKLTGETNQEALLRKQVLLLERELKEARLKQATLETLIDVAEKEHGIAIKKNFGGKQLSK